MSLRMSNSKLTVDARLGMVSLRLAIMIVAIIASSLGTCYAQQKRLPHVWPMYQDDMAPGIIGQTQIHRRPQAYGYFQPVEIRGPEGIRISMATAGVFDEPQPAPFRAALLVGAPYRIRVGGIPFEDGQELYPTIEVIDRLYPLPEREHRMPIIVEMDETDISAAMKGDLVTRVIYLEDSEIAEPVSYADGVQRVQDVYGTEDALHTADQMGRPVAILRIGSRVPSDLGTGDNTEFLFGCPQWFPIKDIPNRQKLIEAGIIQDLSPVNPDPTSNNLQVAPSPAVPVQPVEGKPISIPSTPNSRRIGG
jgi:hypothetical protein